LDSIRPRSTIRGLGAGEIETARRESERPRVRRSSVPYFRGRSRQSDLLRCINLAHLAALDQVPPARSRGDSRSCCRGSASPRTLAVDLPGPQTRARAPASRKRNAAPSRARPSGIGSLRSASPQLHALGADRHALANARMRIAPLSAPSQRHQVRPCSPPPPCREDCIRQTRLLIHDTLCPQASAALRRRSLVASRSIHRFTHRYPSPTTRQTEHLCSVPGVPFADSGSFGPVVGAVNLLGF